MNFAGFQKILASTAAHIDKAVASTVSEVTGPKALSEYDIGEQVGSGGPGLLWKLFRAKPKNKAQQELSAEVCVWFLDKKALADERSKRGTSKAAEETLLDIFRADAKLLQKLRHPGVVRVVEALEESKGAMAMVTEPLFSSVANAMGNYDNMARVPQELKEQELGQLEVKHGILQLTDTLSFLHNNAKLVHRSISPETIFLTTTGGWKFGGFGFATMVDQIDIDDIPFHYPDFDVEAPVLPLQPLLDYSAPELIRRPVKSLMGGGDARTASDMFSLALLTYHLVAKKPLLQCYNNQQTFLNRVMNLHRDPFQGIPLELDNDLRRMLSQDAGARPTASDFLTSPWFRDDIRLRALRFLDQMLERDNLQKTEFFKALSGLWSGFDPRVLRYKVLPALLSELKNEAIQQFTLPLVLLIAENQSPRDFQLYTQPALLPVMQTAAGETRLLLVKHMPMLVAKASVEVMPTHILPMLVAAYEDNDPRIQEETLRRTKDLVLKLDFDVVKAAVLPRVHALALRTSVAAVRVHALICLGDLVQRLDKAAVGDILQTCARCAAVDHSPPTLMCILAVADTVHKQQGVEFAAEHLLPLLTPLLITRQLSAPQFAKYLRFILDILHKIEEMRGVNLSEADAVSLDFDGLGAGTTTLNLAGNGGTNGPSKPLAPSKPTTSWDAADDWGPMSSTGMPPPPPGKDPLGDFMGASLAPLAAAAIPQVPSALPAASSDASWPSSSSPLGGRPSPAPVDPFGSISLGPPSGPSMSSHLTPSPALGVSSAGSLDASWQNLSSSSAGMGLGSGLGGSGVSSIGTGLGGGVGGSSMGVGTGLGLGMGGAGMAGPPSMGGKPPAASQPASPYSMGTASQAPLDDDDPFADWPPRKSGGSMLAPPQGGATSAAGRMPTSTPGQSSAGASIGTGGMMGLGGMGGPMGGGASGGGFSGGASSWGGATFPPPPSQPAQQQDIGDFFASPALRAPTAQQATMGAGIGGGGFGTSMGGAGMGAGMGGSSAGRSPFQLAPPPAASATIRPMTQAVGRGRGRGQAPAQPAPFGSPNQGSLLDLL